MRVDPPPPRPPVQIGESEVAGYGRRAVAFIVDLVFAAVVFVVWAPLAILIAARIGSSGNPENPDVDTLLVIALLVVPFYLLPLFWWGFNALGASPGKRLLGLRIIRGDGSRPGIWGGLLRTVTASIFLSSWSMGGVLSWLWPLWDADTQTWHDKIAKTHVVRTETRRPSSLPATPTPRNA